jgi:hypothetical protein
MQALKLREIAMETKPNPAWRLVAYEIEGHDKVLIEPEQRPSDRLGGAQLSGRFTRLLP